MKEVRIDFVAAFLAAYGIGILINLFAENISDDSYRAVVQCISYLVGLTVFLLIRYLTIASGVFPAPFPLRFLPSWKKFIRYYGVIYYDNNVNKICALFDRGEKEEAAYEFSILAGIELKEAQQAMKFWRRIYGEGIIHKAREKTIS